MAWSLQRTSLTAQQLSTLDTITASSADMFKGGYIDYNDLATQTVPLVISSDTQTALSNDGLGPFSVPGQNPTWSTELWDVATSEFDFTDLVFGTLVFIRTDIEVVTSSPNQRIDVFLEAGQGAGPYSIPFISAQEKNIGTYQLSRLTKLRVDDANTRDNPAQVMFLSDADCTVKVNGWLVSVFQRGLT